MKKRSVFVWIERNKKLLFLFRHAGRWMSGYYSFPSGKVLDQEFPIQAAIREIKEEIGVETDCNNLKLIHLMLLEKGDNSIIECYFYKLRILPTEPINCEPEKHKSLAWHTISNLPSNIAPHCLYAIRQIEKNIDFSVSLFSYKTKTS